MAINTINNGSSGANSAAPTPKAGGRSASAALMPGSGALSQAAAGDQLRLSSESQQLRQATLAADAPVDGARVAELRAAVADGSYRVDAWRTAAKLLDLEQALGGRP